MSELVYVKRFRTQVPDAHRGSIDTRLRWMWNQRFGTIQQIREKSPDVLDHTAATLIMQAVLEYDLNSIELILDRIEGGAITDSEIVERTVTL